MVVCCRVLNLYKYKLSDFIQVLNIEKWENVEIIYLHPLEIFSIYILEFIFKQSKQRITVDNIYWDEKCWYCIIKLLIYIYISIPNQTVSLTIYTCDFLLPTKRQQSQKARCYLPIGMIVKRHSYTPLSNLSITRQLALPFIQTYARVWFSHVRILSGVADLNQPCRICMGKSVRYGVVLSSVFCSHVVSAMMGRLQSTHR